MDEDTLLQLRTEKVELIAIVVKETKDIFITTVAAFRDKEKARYGNYTGRGGTVIRYLPLQHFTKKSGTVKI